MSASNDITLTSSSEKTLSVAAIENGTVIDHITASKAIFLLRLLKLEQQYRQITIGLNLPSSRLKKKDIIKVEGWELSPEETSQIAIFSPQATINIIQNYRVASKYQVTLPKVIEHFLICPNPHCITNHEKAPRLFYVMGQRKDIHLRCKFCEKIFNHTELTQYDI